MSLREKAREVKAAGEAERGNYTPEGRPLQSYQNYYQKTGKKRPATENFCHFYRVVLLWEPLRKFRNAAATVGESVFASVPVLIGLAAASVLVIVYLGLTFTEFGFVMLIVTGALYAIAGLIFGIVYAAEKYEHDNWQADEYGDTFRPQVTAGLRRAVWITGLVSWLPYTLTQVVNRLDESTTRFLRNALGAVALTAMGLFGLLLLWTALGWWLPVYILGVAAGIALLIAAVVAIGTGVQSLRAYSRTRPERPRFDVVIKEPRAPREPGRISKFFSGVADFLVLAAQIARVKKWKICPIVTVPKESIDA